MRIFTYPLCLLLLTFGFVPFVHAQTTYSVSSINYAPDPFAVGTPLNVGLDDYYSGIISLPFSFCFYDSSFTDFVVGTNGFAGVPVSQAHKSG